MADGEKTRVDEAKDELECGICTDLLKDPRSLKCLHSYCRGCLEKLAAHEAMKLNATKDVLVCPECRSATELPPDGVHGLKKAFKLARLVEILTPDDKSNYTCRSHSTSVREDSFRSSRPRCNVHKSRQLNYYCEHCKMLVCGKCMLKEHRSHGEIECAEDVLPTHIEALTGLIPYANEVSTKAANALIRLKEGTDIVRRQGEHEVENVREYFSKLRQVLAEREEELVDTVQREVDQHVHEISKRKQVLQESLERIRASVQFIQDIAENRADDIQVLNEDSKLKVTLLSHADAVEIGSNSLSEVWEVPSVSSPVLVNAQLEQLVKAIGTKTMSSPALPKRTRTIPSERTHAPVHITQSLQMGSPANCAKFLLERTDSNATTYSEPYSPEIPRAYTCVGTVSSPPPTPPIRKESHNHTSEICEPMSIIGEKNLSCSMFRNLSQNVLPCGVCIGSNDTIIVTDSRNHCLRILAPTGKCLDVVGCEGKADGQFILPSAVTVDEDGNILVTDKDTPRIQKFTGAGKFVARFSNRSLRGSYLGEPWGIAVSFDKKILVSDWDKSCIHVYDSSGRYQGNFGLGDQGGFQSALKYPAGIAIDQRGRVIVADRGNHCVWMYTPNGQLLGRFGQKGHAPGDLFYPFGIAVDQDGNIVVSESGNHRISIFTSLGKFKRSFGKKGTAPGCFQYPRHICIDSQSRLIVADELNERLQVFSI